MYAYCNNNPVNLSDPTGTLSRPVPTWSVLSKPPIPATSTSVSLAINTKAPPPSNTGYNAPKSKSPVQKQPAPGSKSGEKGWPDSKGDIWVPDIDMHGGEGWRVHAPDGSHRHVYPNGNQRTHKISEVQVWDSNATYGLYEVSINGEKYLTDTPPIGSNKYDNYYYLPAPVVIPKVPSFSFSPAFYHAFAW